MRRTRGFLMRPEIDALLGAPNLKLWAGRRDRALLLVAVQTGLRLSEITNLHWADVLLGSGAHLRCVGKGRKERCTPLTKEVRTVLRAWFKESSRNANQEIVFPNARGGQLTSGGVQYLLAKHIAVAKQTCPSLNAKRVSPHVLRHYVPFRTMSSAITGSL
jgi:site-specific recombinase XerD